MKQAMNSKFEFSEMELTHLNGIGSKSFWEGAATGITIMGVGALLIT